MHGSDEDVDAGSLFLLLDVAVDGGGGSEEDFSLAPGHFTPLVPFLTWSINFLCSRYKSLCLGNGLTLLYHISCIPQCHTFSSFVVL